IRMVPSGNCTSSHITSKSLTSSSYLASSSLTEMPLRFMYVCGLARRISSPCSLPRPTKALPSGRSTRIEVRFASSSTAMKPRLCGGLGLLGFAFGAFFAFHFFLALLDDFRLGWCCAFSGNDFGRLLFFDLERDHVRENLFGIGEELHLAGIDLQIACAESLIQHQATDIGFELAGDIAGQAFDFDFAGDNLEDAALDFYAGGIAERVHGDLDAHADVHGDAKKVDVEQVTADGIVEPILEDGGLMLAVEVDLKKSVVAAFRTQNGVDLFGVHRESNGVAFAAVEDGGDAAARAEAARFVFSTLGAGSCFYYYLLLILSHASSLLVFPTGRAEARPLQLNKKFADGRFLVN